MKKLCVIIVSYNVKYYVEQCVTALKWAMRDIDSEIIVIDNHSRDNSVDYLQDRFQDSITVISSNHNLGFARANNIAIQQTDAEYILLLNPDTIVTEESIQQSVSFMDEHPKAGALGVRMIQATGANAPESRRGTPTPMTSFYKMCGLCSRFPNSKRFGKYYMSGIPWDEPNQIEIVSGAFCMLRHSALDNVGLLDDEFFMYGEDVDLSYRLLQAGYENWYLPATILHYKGESTHKSTFRYVHVFYNAMLIFFRKHYGHLSFFITLPIKMAIVMKAASVLIGNTWDSWKDSLGMRRHSDFMQPLYVFIGTRFTLDQCRTLAKNKGLEAKFHEGTVGTLPNGHRDMQLPEKRPVVVVYDVHAYKYSQIFKIFSENMRENVSIGTYDNFTHKLITVNEVIYDDTKKKKH